MEAKNAASCLVQIRKLRGMTQKQLAEKVGISRELLAAYELGRLHFNDDTIVRFAIALRTTTDELLGLKPNALISASAPSIRLVRRMQLIAQLPSAEQKAILKTIDTFLKGADRKEV